MPGPKKGRPSEIQDGKFQQFYLSDNCNKFTVLKGSFKELRFLNINIGGSKYVVKNLHINFQHLTGMVIIDGYKIGKGQFFGTINKETEFHLKDIFFNELTFDNVYNNGKIRIFDIKAINDDGNRNWFSIIRSNIGKADFVNVDLRKIDTILINSSYLLECTFVNVEWPDNLKITTRLSGVSNFLDLKETYRQLKHAYSKQSDSVSEHSFHALEMNAYDDYLKETLKENRNHRFLQRTRIWQTRFVLCLSKATSDYGQSLIRPLAFMFASGIVLFTIAVACNGIDGYYFRLKNNVRQMMDTFPALLSFINPLRKYEASDVNWGLTADFFMRIISSYCIYNFVRATRRFVK